MMEDAYPREVRWNKLSELNQSLKVEADFPDTSNGNGSHAYKISGDSYHLRCFIDFQKGAVKEYGVNGISDEALLVVLIDRLQCFQKGEFSCRENALALTKMEEAMHWLNARTLDRMNRGVEGKSLR